MEATARADVATTVRNLQTVYVSMMAGVVGLAGIALVVPFGDGGGNVLARVGTVVAAVALAAKIAVVPRVERAQLDRLGAHEPAAADRMLGIYHSRLLLEAGLVEGAALLNVVAFIVDRQRLSLLIAALLLASMALAFPTRSRVERWLERHRPKVSGAQRSGETR